MWTNEDVPCAARAAESANQARTTNLESFAGQVAKIREDEVEAIISDLLLDHDMVQEIHDQILAADRGDELAKLTMETFVEANVGRCHDAAWALRALYVEFARPVAEKKWGNCRVAITADDLRRDARELDEEDCRPAMIRARGER